MNNLDNLQKVLNYTFNDIKNLEISLTHQSYANEHEGVESYERLEFLGDAVIEMVVSKHIYDYVKSSSGVLTKIRSYLVSTENLSKISKDLGLDKYMLSSKSLSSIGKKNSADLFESLIGAIYIDGGLDPCKKVIEKYIIVDKENIDFAIENCDDSKTQVQELCQKQIKTFEYVVVSSSGQDHEKIFEVVLNIEGEKVSQAKGRSIREAEENCAKNYLKILKQANV